MDTSTLQEFVKQVRGDTLRLLEATPPGWMTWAPDRTSNHIAWHTGHALWLGDVLCVERITGQSELPEGWAETFGMNCRPLCETTEWPSGSELSTLLASQRDRMLELIGELSLDRFVIPDPPPAHGRDLIRGIIHGLHDEAKHQGEAYLLFKLCRAHGVATQ